MIRHGPPPDAFAVVMASAILAVAAAESHYRPLALVLFAVAAAALVVLVGWLAVGVRGLRRSARELRAPDVVLRAFTLVAALTVLSAAVQQLFGGPGWAVELLAAAGFAVWLVLLPIAVRDVGARRPSQLRDQVHGAWLLVSVATSGLAIAAAALAVRLGTPVLVAAAAAPWLLAILLYLVLVALVIWRLVSAPLVPAEVTPDSWVLMGALAISALTGNHVQAALAALDVTAGAAAAHGLTVAAQVAAMAWLVPLLGAQVWTAGKIPGLLTYRDAWWAAVFPLGMFAAASAATARTWPLEPLTTVALVVFWDALAIWVVVAAGLVHHGVRAVRRRRTAERAVG
ncbi:C4-dicarboxylate transporter/malic acid transport protein [Pseudonocardia dioxanivorans CB1190]|uniref:C4-dicarboxylate transporter/malic acid transport protein n=1 Tax=Pseudonocardia dioxanivorans (strain ATCC 55486 / DSM 44775 / JCM 13855 / CB1190) TaxID=675635 RepID=F4CRY9_PSEUX|nr:C4-dicarboxylate ABC transporter [Pseudonocardia dioxanivorans]AEA28433.1 C4-dicarboxylate transporter/malic acid transport protein [Pseudonocardia dioxanivorans CB1190]